MTYFYWITGVILALAWFSRIVDAAVGMPSVADVSKAEWDRDPVLPAGNPRVSIIVPARNEEGAVEQALRSLLALDYDNYEVIAVNDRSTDRTGEIMERVARELIVHSESQKPHLWQNRPEAGHTLRWLVTFWGGTLAGPGLPGGSRPLTVRSVLRSAQ